MKRLLNVNIAVLKKFLNPLNASILLFYTLFCLLISYLKATEVPLFTGQTGTLSAIIITQFENLIFSIIPLLLVISISREISLGYTGKLLALGLTRNAYLKQKIFLIFQLSILSCLIYAVLFAALLTITNGEPDISVAIKETPVLNILIAATTIFIQAGFFAFVVPGMIGAVAAFLAYGIVDLSINELLLPSYRYLLPLSPAKSLITMENFVMPDGFLLSIIFYSIGFGLVTWKIVNRKSF